MKFDFNKFSNEKQKALSRLNRGKSFSETTVNLQDIIIDKKKEEKRGNN